MPYSLHVWIGNPKSASDLSFLLSSLETALPKTKGNVEVVFEKELLQLIELASGFTNSGPVREEIEKRGQQFGIESATAMFGMHEESQLLTASWPNDLLYLGLFQIEDADQEAETNEEESSILVYRAVIEGDLATTKLLLQSNPESVGQRNEVGHTPLMASATTERADITALLLDMGASAEEVAPDNGYTALHWALHHPPNNQQDVVAVVGKLLAHGANANAIGLNGITPVMLAAWFGAEPAVELLLEHGSNPKLTDAKGKTARDLALQRGNLKIEKMLNTAEKQWDK